MLFEIRSPLLRHIAGALVVGIVIAIFIGTPYAVGRYALEQLWPQTVAGVWLLAWLVGIMVIVVGGYALIIVLAFIIPFLLGIVTFSIGAGEALFGREGEG